jgi:hypothetical protein
MFCAYIVYITLTDRAKCDRIIKRKNSDEKDEAFLVQSAITVFSQQVSEVDL